MTPDKALERALHIDAFIRIEEEDIEPRVSAIKSNENSYLYNSINDLVRTSQSRQPGPHDNQKFIWRRARPKKFLPGRDQSLRETGDRKRNHNSYKRSSAVNTRAYYDRKMQSPTPGGESRSQDWLYEIWASSQRGQQFLNKNLAIAVNKTVHPENAGMVSNVRAQKNLE